MTRLPITKADADRIANQSPSEQAAKLVECERFMADIAFDINKYAKCYDNGGKTFDRYTVIFTRSSLRNRGRTIYVGMSDSPFAPNGFGQHGDAPAGTIGNLGKRIEFSELPPDCQNLVIQDIRDIWDIR